MWQSPCLCEAKVRGCRSRASICKSKKTLASVNCRLSQATGGSFLLLVTQCVGKSKQFSTQTSQGQQTCVARWCTSMESSSFSSLIRADSGSSYGFT